MSLWGYVRVSTDEQSIENQKLAILSYANKHKLTVDEWIDAKVSSRRSIKERRIQELLDQIKEGDTIIAAELSRLGRSVGQIAILVDELITNKIKLICLKENICLDNQLSMQNKVVLTMFSLFAEIERDLISERTKEGLAKAKAEGKLLGRPKGSLGKSKLDGKENEIKQYLIKKVNKANIARIYGVSWPTLDNFIKTRGISITKEVKVNLWLRVENNNKHVRGRKRAREEIERDILSQYQMKKLDKDGWEYELSIPHDNDEELDKIIYDMLKEVNWVAELRNCFTEVDVREKDSDRTW